MKDKRKMLFALFVGILVISLVSFCFAAKPNENSTDANGKVNNMTYGKCVVAGVEIKNNCYALAKDAKTLCANNSRSAQDTKTALKTCSNEYKNQIANCKKEFKSAKNECKRVKHNFLETMRYSLA